jgi:hypothetical protein
LIGFSCAPNLAKNDLSNAENRRVSITVHEMATYTAKNGYVIFAPKDMKLKVIDHFYQPDLVSNWYKNKECKRPMPKGYWRYADVDIQSKEDSCRFILVKIPKMTTGLPVLFFGNQYYKIEYGATDFSADSAYSWFRIPIYSNYIALNQFRSCGHYPRVFLHIAVPNDIRPLKASLVDACLTVPAVFKKDTVLVEMSPYTEFHWSQLNLKIKTRDTICEIPMSEFEEVAKINYSAGLYILRHRNNWPPALYPKPAMPEKRRTFWQRILDLFR